MSRNHGHPKGGKVTVLPPTSDPAGRLETRILCSYAYWPRVERLVEVIEEGIASGLKLDLFMDSGAFSALNRGMKITVESYAQWLTPLLPHTRVFANLDVIGDGDATFRNQLALEDRIGQQPMPVYHTGTPFEHLERYIKAGYRNVALGGMADRNRRQPLSWTIQCFKIAEAAGVRLHGFGITDAKMIKMFPWDSVDSSGWLTGERFARISLFNSRTGKMEGVQLTTGNVERLWRSSDQARAVGVQLRTIGHAVPGQRFVREQRIAMARINIESVVKLEAFCRRMYRDRQLRLYLVAGNQMQFRDCTETMRRIITHDAKRKLTHLQHGIEPIR